MSLPTATGPTSTHPAPWSPRRWLVEALLDRQRGEIEAALTRGVALTTLAELLGVDRRTAQEAAARLGWRYGWHKQEDPRPESWSGERMADQVRAAVGG